MKIKTLIQMTQIGAPDLMDLLGFQKITVFNSLDF